jgi:hypothetical protein
MVFLRASRDPSRHSVNIWLGRLRGTKSGFLLRRNAFYNTVALSLSKGVYTRSAVVAAQCLRHRQAQGYGYDSIQRNFAINASPKKVRGRWYCYQRPLRLRLEVLCHKGNSFLFSGVRIIPCPEGPRTHQTAVGFSSGVDLGGEALTRTWTSVVLQQPSLPVSPACAFNLIRSGVWLLRCLFLTSPKVGLSVAASLPDKHKVSSKTESDNDIFMTYPQGESLLVDKLENNNPHAA